MEGYGKDFSFWDAYVQERFKEQIKTLEKHSYHNFEVFKSLKGRWMAFHNTNYMDIRIIDLETLETVVENFYSLRVLNDKGEYDRDQSVYDGFHTNYSTFVPTYLKGSFVHKGGKRKDQTTVYYTEVSEIDESYRKRMIEDNWFSAPIAFNAFTMWAADHEFYVDVLDLSRVDDGIIRKFPEKPSFIIPRSASYVRNFVEFSLDYTYDLEETEPGIHKATGTSSADRGEYIIDFTVLQERTRDRYEFNLNTKEHKFYDMFDSTDIYKPEDKLPWEEVKKKKEEYQKTKAQRGTDGLLS